MKDPKLKTKVVHSQTKSSWKDMTVEEVKNLKEGDVIRNTATATEYTIVRGEKKLFIAQTNVVIDNLSEWIKLNHSKEGE